VFQNFIQPSIEILNVRIDEPITSSTDLLFAAICFYAYFQIKKGESTGKIKWYFKYYFLALGFGALFGGLLGHAFLYTLSPGWQLLSWIFSLFAVGLIAHALVEMARPLAKPWFIRWISIVNLLVLAIAIFYTLWTFAFSPVKYYSIFGMVMVAGSLSYYIHLKTHQRGVALLMGAIGIGIVSVLIFSLKWGVSPWFNHKDISHVLLSFSVYGFYKGAALILN
jgi:MFS family permease